VIPEGEGLVVCPQPLAAGAGGRMLEQGGNAVDGAVAAALAQGVVDPMMCGLGGTARALLYTGSREDIKMFAGRPYAGRLARPESFEYERSWELYPNRHDVRGAANYVGHTAAVVPTALRVLYDVHAHAGALPWRTVVEPAISLAHDGFAVYPYLYRHWDEDAEAAAGDYGPPPRARLTANAAAEAIYLNGDRVFAVGELLRQPDYGRTLEAIASRGADAMYRGEIAEMIAADFAAQGAFVTLDDLRDAKTVETRTLVGTYQDSTVVTDAPPAAGHSYIQALNILEAVDDLGTRDPVSYWDVLARAFHATYAFRGEHSGDPGFVDVPLDEFLSKKRASEIAAGLDHVLEAPSASTENLPRESTTSVSVLDRFGNAAIVTHSNGSSAGVVTPGLGFLYNNHMHNFDPRPGRRNSIAYGKIAEHGTPMVLWFRDGELVGMDGSLSRFALTADLQVTLAIERGVDPQAAVEAPRLHAEYAPGRLYVEPDFPPDILHGLEERGWSPTTRSMTAPLGLIRKTALGVVGALDPRGGQGRWPEQPSNPERVRRNNE
jgi:gamma-glutamyltranspeptidase / glutathione hydrolase